MEDLQLQSTPTSVQEETTAAPSEEVRYGMALDPGETAGLVIVKFDHQKFELVQVSEVYFHDEMMESLNGALGCFLPEIIVCENFRLYAHKAKVQIRSTFPTVEMIGALKALCWVNGLDDPIMQSPTCKGNVSVLPEHKGVVGSSPHKQDAYRHFRYWWLTEYRS